MDALSKLRVFETPKLPTLTWCQRFQLFRSIPRVELVRVSKDDINVPRSIHVYDFVEDEQIQSYKKFKRILSYNDPRVKTLLEKCKAEARVARFDTFISTNELTSNPATREQMAPSPPVPIKRPRGRPRKDRSMPPVLADPPVAKVAKVAEIGKVSNVVSRTPVLKKATDKNLWSATQTTAPVCTHSADSQPSDAKIRRTMFAACGSQGRSLHDSVPKTTSDEKIQTPSKAKPVHTNLVKPNAIGHAVNDPAKLRKSKSFEEAVAEVETMKLVSKTGSPRHTSNETSLLSSKNGTDWTRKESSPQTAVRISSGSEAHGAHSQKKHSSSSSVVFSDAKRSRSVPPKSPVNETNAKVTKHVSSKMLSTSSEKSAEINKATDTHVIPLKASSKVGSGSVEYDRKKLSKGNDSQESAPKISDKTKTTDAKISHSKAHTSEHSVASSNGEERNRPSESVRYKACVSESIVSAAKRDVTIPDKHKVVLFPAGDKASHSRKESSNSSKIDKTSAKHHSKHFSGKRKSTDYTESSIAKKSSSHHSSVEKSSSVSSKSDSPRHTATSSKPTDSSRREESSSKDVPCNNASNNLMRVLTQSPNCCDSEDDTLTDVEWLARVERFAMGIDEPQTSRNKETRAPENADPSSNIGNSKDGTVDSNETDVNKNSSLPEKSPASSKCHVSRRDMQDKKSSGKDKLTSKSIDQLKPEATKKVYTLKNRDEARSSLERKQREALSTNVSVNPSAENMDKSTATEETEPAVENDTDNTIFVTQFFRDLVDQARAAEDKVNQAKLLRKQVPLAPEDFESFCNKYAPVFASFAVKKNKTNAETGNNIPLETSAVMPVLNSLPASNNGVAVNGVSTATNDSEAYEEVAIAIAGTEVEVADGELEVTVAGSDFDFDVADEDIYGETAGSSVDGLHCHNTSESQRDEGANLQSISFDDQETLSVSTFSRLLAEGRNSSSISELISSQDLPSPSRYLEVDDVVISTRASVLFTTRTSVPDELTDSENILDQEASGANLPSDEEVVPAQTDIVARGPVAEENLVSSDPTLKQYLVPGALFLFVPTPIEGTVHFKSSAPVPLLKAIETPISEVTDDRPSTCTLSEVTGDSSVIETPQPELTEPTVSNTDCSTDETATEPIAAENEPTPDCASDSDDSDVKALSPEEIAKNTKEIAIVDLTDCDDDCVIVDEFLTCDTRSRVSNGCILGDTVIKLDEGDDYANTNIAGLPGTSVALNGSGTTKATYEKLLKEVIGDFNPATEQISITQSVIEVPGSSVIQLNQVCANSTLNLVDVATISSMPPEEGSQSSEEPSLPTEEPSFPQEDPSLPQEEASLPREEPSLSLEEPSLPQVEPSLLLEEPILPANEPSLPMEAARSILETAVEKDSDNTYLEPISIFGRPPRCRSSPPGNFIRLQRGMMYRKSANTSGRGKVVTAKSQPMQKDRSAGKVPGQNSVTDDVQETSKKVKLQTCPEHFDNCRNSACPLVNNAISNKKNPFRFSWSGLRNDIKTINDSDRKLCKSFFESIDVFSVIPMPVPDHATTERANGEGTSAATREVDAPFSFDDWLSNGDTLLINNCWRTLKLNDVTKDDQVEIVHVKIPFGHAESMNPSPVPDVVLKSFYRVFAIVMHCTKGWAGLFYTDHFNKNYEQDLLTYRKYVDSRKLEVARLVQLMLAHFGQIRFHHCLFSYVKQVIDDHMLAPVPIFIPHLVFYEFLGAIMLFVAMPRPPHSREAEFVSVLESIYEKCKILHGKVESQLVLKKKMSVYDIEKFKEERDKEDETLQQIIKETANTTVCKSHQAPAEEDQPATSDVQLPHIQSVAQPVGAGASQPVDASTTQQTTTAENVETEESFMGDPSPLPVTPQHVNDQQQTPGTKVFGIIPPPPKMHLFKDIVNHVNPSLVKEAVPPLAATTVPQNISPSGDGVRPEPIIRRHKTNFESHQAEIHTQPQAVQQPLNELVTNQTFHPCSGNTVDQETSQQSSNQRFDREETVLTFGHTQSPQVTIESNSDSQIPEPQQAHLITNDQRTVAAPNWSRQEVQTIDPPCGVNMVTQAQDAMNIHHTPNDQTNGQIIQRPSKSTVCKNLYPLLTGKNDRMPNLPAQPSNSISDENGVDHNINYQRNCQRFDEPSEQRSVAWPATSVESQTQAGLLPTHDLPTQQRESIIQTQSQPNLEPVSHSKDHHSPSVRGSQNVHEEHSMLQSNEETSSSLRPDTRTIYEQYAALDEREQQNFLKRMHGHVAQTIYVCSPSCPYGKVRMDVVQKPGSVSLLVSPIAGFFTGHICQQPRNASEEHTNDQRSSKQIVHESMVQDLSTRRCNKQSTNSHSQVPIFEHPSNMPAREQISDQRIKENINATQSTVLRVENQPPPTTASPSEHRHQQEKISDQQINENIVAAQSPVPPAIPLPIKSQASIRKLREARLFEKLTGGNISYRHRLPQQPSGWQPGKHMSESRHASAKLPPVVPQSINQPVEVPPDISTSENCLVEQPSAKQANDQHPPRSPLREVRKTKLIPSNPETVENNHIQNDITTQPDPQSSSANPHTTPASTNNLQAEQPIVQQLGNQSVQKQSNPKIIDLTCSPNILLNHECMCCLGNIPLDRAVGYISPDTRTTGTPQDNSYQQVSGEETDKGFQMRCRNLRLLGKRFEERQRTEGESTKQPNQLEQPATPTPPEINKSPLQSKQSVTHLNIASQQQLPNCQQSCSKMIDIGDEETVEISDSPTEKSMKPKKRNAPKVTLEENKQYKQLRQQDMNSSDEHSSGNTPPQPRSDVTIDKQPMQHVNADLNDTHIPQDQPQDQPKRRYTENGEIIEMHGDTRQNRSRVEYVNRIMGNSRREFEDQVQRSNGFSLYQVPPLLEAGNTGDTPTYQQNANYDIERNIIPESTVPIKKRQVPPDATGKDKSDPPSTEDCTQKKSQDGHNTGTSPQKGQQQRVDVRSSSIDSGIGQISPTTTPDSPRNSWQSFEDAILAVSIGDAPKCRVCNVDATVTCGACSRVNYCGYNCQVRRH